MDPHVVFQVDSSLVANQMARHEAWACRSPDLIPLRNDCRELGQALTDAAVRWAVRHIYREYNQTADTLANEGVDEHVAFRATRNW